MQIKEKLQKDLPTIAVTVLCVAVGAVCGLLMNRVTDRAAADGISKGVCIFMSYMILVMMFVLAFLQVLIHEAGHLIFGLIFKFKFVSFRILNLMILKQNGKTVLKKVHIAGTGGQCLLAPPALEGVNTLWFNLGGVILNAVTALISAILFVVFSDVVFLSECFLIFALFGFTFALINGVPMKNTPIGNDGTNALETERSSEAKRAMLVQLKINELVQNGMRMKDMPAELFEYTTGAESRSGMEAALPVFMCNRLLDQHRFDEAKILAKNLISSRSKAVGIHKNLLTCDAIYIELISKNDADTVRKLYTKEIKAFMRSMKNFPSVIRTEYALQLLHFQCKEKADDEKKRFEKTAKTYPSASDIASERELISIASEMIR